MDTLIVSIPLELVKLPPPQVVSNPAARPPGRFSTVKLNGGKLSFYKENSAVDNIKSVNYSLPSIQEVPVSDFSAKFLVLDADG